MKKIVSLLLIVVIMSMSLSNIVFAINEISDDIIRDEQKNDNSLVENDTSFDSKENQNVTTDNENTEKENNNEEQEDSNKEIINEENENNINEDEQEIEQYENIEEKAVKAEIETGTYVIKSALNKNKVFDISGGNKNNLANLQIWSRDSVPQQKFIITKLNDGSYIIMAKHSKKVLDVAGAKKKNGTNVQQYESNNTDAQKWILEQTDDGYISFVSKCNNLYIDIDGASTKNGTNIQLYEGNNTLAQKFILEKVEEPRPEKTIDDGVYTISTALNASKVLEIKDGNKSNYANLQISTNINKDYQKFKVTYLNDGYYRIESINSKKVLDVNGAGERNGTNVQQYESNGSDAQKWIIYKTKDGYYNIISKCNGLYLDIAGASTKDKTNVQVYSENESKAQKFQFKAVKSYSGTQTIKDGTYAIKSYLNDKKCLDISGGSRNNGANTQLWDYTNVKQQKYNIKYLGNGYYSIIAVHSKKSLDVSSALAVNGTNVQQYEWNNSDAQKWIIKQTDDVYYNIIYNCNDLFINVTAGNTQNGTNIQMYEENGSDAQKFKFEEVKIEVGTKTISNGTYVIKSVLNPNKCVDISGGSRANSANVQLWDFANVQQQRFDITYIGDGCYKIISRHSSKSLDVNEAKNINGTNVQQYEWNNSNAQKWIIKDVGNGYYNIISFCNDLYLDISGGSTSNGTNIQMYDDNGTNSQKFMFEKSYGGIDVSTFNYGINWAQVADYGVDFALIRAGFRGYESGTIVHDSYFLSNIQGAKAHGIRTGIYFFTQAVNEGEAIEEANWAINVANQNGLTYPVIAIDVEWSNKDKDGRADWISNQDRTNVVNAFCRTVRNAGYTPLIYANMDWLKNKLYMDQLKEYDVWLAHYTWDVNNKSNYQGNYSMWQYSSKGSISGIGTAVDMNICYKEY